MGRLQWLGNTLANCKQHGSSDDEYFGHLTKIGMKFSYVWTPNYAAVTSVNAI